MYNQFKEFDQIHPCEKALHQQVGADLFYTHLLQEAQTVYEDDLIKTIAVSPNKSSVFPTNLQEMREWIDNNVKEVRHRGLLAQASYIWKRNGQPTFVVESEVLSQLSQTTEEQKRINIGDLKGNIQKFLFYWNLMSERAEESLKFLEKLHNLLSKCERHEKFSPKSKSIYDSVVETNNCLDPNCEVCNDNEAIFILTNGGEDGLATPYQAFFYLFHKGNIPEIQDLAFYNHDPVFQAFHYNLISTQKMLDVLLERLPQTLSQIDMSCLEESLYVKLPSSCKAYSGFLLRRNSVRIPDFKSLSKKVSEHYMTRMEKGRLTRSQKKSLRDWRRKLKIEKSVKPAWVSIVEEVWGLVAGNTVFENPTNYTIMLFPRRTEKWKNMLSNMSDINSQETEVFRFGTDLTSYLSILEWLSTKKILTEFGYYENIGHWGTSTGTEDEIVKEMGSLLTNQYVEEVWGGDRQLSGVDSLVVDFKMLKEHLNLAQYQDKIEVLNFISNFLFSLQRTSVVVKNYKPNRKKSKRKGRKKETLPSLYKYIVLDTDTKEVITHMYNGRKSYEDRKKAHPHERGGGPDSRKLVNQWVTRENLREGEIVIAAKTGTSKKKTKLYLVKRTRRGTYVNGTKEEAQAYKKEVRVRARKKED